MKKTLIALAAATAMGFGTAALADEAVSGPVMMSDVELDLVVGARGRSSGPGCCDSLATPQSNFGSGTFGVAEAADGDGSGKGLPKAENKAGSSRVNWEQSL